MPANCLKSPERNRQYKTSLVPTCGRKSESELDSPVGLACVSGERKQQVGASVVFFCWPI